MGRAAVGMVRQGLPGAGVPELVPKDGPNVGVWISHQRAQGRHQNGPNDVQVPTHGTDRRKHLLRCSIEAVLEGQ